MLNQRLEKLKYKERSAGEDLMTAYHNGSDEEYDRARYRYRVALGRLVAYQSFLDIFKREAQHDTR